MKLYKIPANAWFLSLVSLFNDTASEMLYPVMPIFLTQVLGAPVFVVGIIEGIAEGSASFFKAYFGYLSDKLQKRKPFVIAGYGAGAISKIIIALSYSWPIVLLGRFVDRLGKGTRTGARDALLLEVTDDSNRGFIFGFHRTMDTLGAVIGPLIALLLLNLTHNNIRLILYVSIIPALFSLTFFYFVKDAQKKLMTNKVKLSLSLQGFPKQFKIFLAGMALFSLGNSSDSFLILRSQSLGLSLSAVILAYVFYNISYAGFSTPAGIISDKIGTKKVFILGIIIFTLVYLGFALNTHSLLIWFLFPIYGIYIALTDGVAKALVGSLIAPERAGTAYGAFYTVTSMFTLMASVIGGFLWSLISPEATFLFAVLCASLSIVIFSMLKLGSNEK